MAINIYSVANHLEENNWKLISDTYKNLDTELEMICPQGHQQVQTYRNWRKYQHCDKCMGNEVKKIKKNKVPAKTADTTRVLALDAATGTTGYAIYDNQELVAYGTFKTNAEKETTERIHEVKKWLEGTIENINPDFCIVEDIQLQKYGTHSDQVQVKTYNALARLQGIILDTLFEQCIDSTLVSVNTWRHYCGVGEGVGRETKKKQAQEKVKIWYGQDCTQDEADAICIGKYGCHILKNTKSSWGEDI